MSLDIQAIAAQAAAQGPNMNEAQKSSARQVAAAGPCIAILVSYIETGMHATTYQGKAKAPAPQYEATFELHSANHSQTKDDNGNVRVDRITISGSIYLNDKAGYYKLFKKLNYDGTATHFAQLVGKHWLARVVHNSKGEGNEKRTYANLKDEGGFLFQPPVRPGDPLTGSPDVPIAKPETISPLRLFLWDFATREQWDSIFVDGMWDEVKDDSGKVTRAAQSKNKWQDKIRVATNFAGSPISEILAAGALTFEADATPDVSAAQATDPLAGMS